MLHSDWKEKKNQQKINSGSQHRTTREIRQSGVTIQPEIYLVGLSSVPEKARRQNISTCALA